VRGEQVATRGARKARRLAFVTPRYGRDVVGGSEAVVAEAARGLAARGDEVDVLTTCARSHYTWANELPAGTSTDEGVTIWRFPTVAGPARSSALELELALQAGERLSPAQELAWLNSRFQVPDLYHFLGAQAEDYDAVVLSPYLFWSTVYGAQAAPGRAILMPCLHDEPYAWLSVVAATLSSVAGAWFLSEPEHELAHRVAPGLAPRHRVVGAAVEAPANYDPDGFRRRHRLDRPFILYAGRREAGKGWVRLLSAFSFALRHHDLPFDLVTVGVGNSDIPRGLRGRVIDLGFLEAKELPDAFAAATALVQPSENESFSRTVMEAWLAKKPVIATASGAVVAWHLERSGGGLVYADDVEFGECLSFLAQAPASAAALGEAGRAYVLSNYTWDRVLDEMDAFLDEFTAARQ
jgi:glycosyltransferase involved in cell wall biosynthesis